MINSPDPHGLGGVFSCQIVGFRQGRSANDSRGRASGGPIRHRPANDHRVSRHLLLIELDSAKSHPSFVLPRKVQESSTVRVSTHEVARPFPILFRNFNRPGRIGRGSELVRPNARLPKNFNCPLTRAVSRAVYDPNG